MPAVAIAPMIRRDIGDDKICVLTFDRPESGANIFDVATLDELNEHLDFVENDASLRGLIIASAKKSIFIAGADLKTLLQQAQSGEMREFIAKGQRIFDRLADLKIPTVAAIHGASAGGGYEVTLACDYRIASDDPATRMGLPETTLGLIPAWGGCTRLPRLIGVEKAAEVILKGKLYSAKEALRLGLVDEIAPRDQLLDRAREKMRAGKRKVEGPVPATPGSPELAPSRQTAVDLFSCDVAQDYGDATGAEPLRDTRAHHASADHSGVYDSFRCRSRRGAFLVFFRQEKIPNQVLRRLRFAEIDNYIQLHLQ